MIVSFHGFGNLKTHSRRTVNSAILWLYKRPNTRRLLLAFGVFFQDENFDVFSEEKYRSMLCLITVLLQNHHFLFSYFPQTLASSQTVICVSERQTHPCQCAVVQMKLI